MCIRDRLRSVCFQRHSTTFDESSGWKGNGLRDIHIWTRIAVIPDGGDIVAVEDDPDDDKRKKEERSPTSASYSMAKVASSDRRGDTSLAFQATIRRGLASERKKGRGKRKITNTVFASGTDAGV